MTDKTLKDYYEEYKTVDGDHDKALAYAQERKAQAEERKAILDAEAEARKAILDSKLSDDSKIAALSALTQGKGDLFLCFVVSVCVLLNLWSGLVTGLVWFGLVWCLVWCLVWSGSGSWSGLVCVSLSPCVSRGGVLVSLAD
jgi:hypothetical protein